MKQSLFEYIRSIFEWSKMPIEQRYNVVLAVGIVGLVAIIYYQNDRLSNKRIECLNERMTLQKEINYIKDSHLDYLKKMDAEYRELLKILNQIN